jgi:soluble lytic murein transglycosylase-like protein
MRVEKTVRLGVLTCACLFAGAVGASADIVYLSSGRTLSVKNYREDGPSITLTLRGGGEVTCDRSLVDKIVPDEVPHPDPAPALQGVAPDSSSILQATPYGDLIAAAAEAHGVNPLLVRALIQVESNYNPRARSHKGAMGLMQLMPETARQYNVRTPFDPKANIEAGVQQLKVLIDRWGLELGLAAYNAGEAVVQRFNGIPPYRETRSYVTRIIALAGLK